MDESSELDLKSLVESQLAVEKDEEIDPKNLRYALYARKSTESAERQARSIPDQIDDCYESFITPQEIMLRQSDIFKEERSAKEAGTRPEFKRLLDAIEAGKYDGIIAWHPDRLARNMKEAGEIIDLIDRNIIKDLRFARAHFENTPSGKMTLGISFVLSKHYSEHLSESVNRGNKRITEKGGVLFKQKHGYRIMEDHKLVADGDNYLLIQQAFEMRKKGKLQKEIAEFLNNSSYQVWRRGKGHRDYTFDEDAVSKLLKDPTYAGVIRYGLRVGKISDYDPTFTPMLTEQEFLALHGEKNFLSKSFRATAKGTNSDDSDFLRRCVICDDCKRYMTTTVIKNHLKRNYFYFRCETKGGCKMAGSGPRGSVILDYVVAFLNAHHFTTKSNYEKYRADVEEKLRFDTQENDRLIGQGTVLLGKKKKEYENAKRAAADKTNPLSKHYTAHELDKLKAEVNQIAKELKKVRAKKGRQDEALMSYEDFLELFGNTVELLRSTEHMTQADEIVRIFFLNFTVKGELKPPNYKIKQWSVIGHRLQKPYDDFDKNNDFLVGRGERT